MTSHIRISPALGDYVICAAGKVMGRTSAALELREADDPPVIYVPRADVDMALMEASLRSSICPWKGWASYYSVRTPDGLLKDVVWSYETPKAEVALIAGYLAFYPDHITVAPR